MKVRNKYTLLLFMFFLSGCSNREKMKTNVSEILTSSFITKGKYIDVNEDVLLTYSFTAKSEGLTHNKLKKYEIIKQDDLFLIGEPAVGGLQELTYFSEKAGVYYRDSQRTIWDNEVSDRKFFKNSPFINLEDSSMNVYPVMLIPKVFKLSKIDTLSSGVLVCVVNAPEYSNDKLYIHPKIGILSHVAPHYKYQLRKIESSITVTIPESFYDELYKL